jgi:hypothetical protein
VVVHDGDKFTEDLLAKYGIKGMVVAPDWSTYKMMAGFKEVQTALCVRVHNDCFFARDDWAEQLVAQFNQTEEDQIIGSYHPSGIMAKDVLEKVAKRYSQYEEEYNKLPFDENGRTQASFLAAFFTASQSRVFKEIYPAVMEINENKMDKEDCLLTLLAKVNGVTITNWENMFQFVHPVGKSGEFDEGLQLPTRSLKVGDHEKGTLEDAVFKKI